MNSDCVGVRVADNRFLCALPVGFVGHSVTKRFWKRIPSR